ncbi:hypothetical protein ACIRRA_41705 [Nocardia sp. NPDC101769]|uniref:hypothetical protein n=1 Tax=Nocardia sp. NPDC101769 TaxID=3364333 RepID=UPI00381F7C88
MPRSKSEIIRSDRVTTDGSSGCRSPGSAIKSAYITSPIGSRARVGDIEAHDGDNPIPYDMPRIVSAFPDTFLTNRLREHSGDHMSPTPETDENTWQPPAAWWAKAVPFRGLGPKRRPMDIAGGAKQFRDWIAEIASQLDHAVSTNALQQPELVAEGMAYLDNSDPTPRGAAIAARILRTSHVTRPDGWPELVVDGWLSHGVEFAVEAAVSVGQFTVADGRRLHEVPGLTNPDYSEELWIRLRTYLADATDDEYATATARLGELRQADPWPLTLMAASYLIPDNQRWLDTVIADPRLHGNDYRKPLLLLSACVTTPEQVDRLAAMHKGDVVGNQYNWQTRNWGMSDRLFNVATQVGPGAARVVAGMLDRRGIDSRTAATLATVLAEFPTDEAFGLLLRRLDHRQVAKVTLKASQRFPRRAMRQLAAADPNAPGVGDLLRGHRAAFPELASEFGIGGRKRREVPVDHLPEVLRTAPKPPAPKRSRPVIVPGIRRVVPMSLAWAPGEREDWASAKMIMYPNMRDAFARYDNDWYRCIGEVLTELPWSQRKSGLGPSDLPRLLTLAPEDVAAHYLPVAPPVSHGYCLDDQLRSLLGRYGLVALPFVKGTVEKDLKYSARLLMPITGTEISELMAELLTKKTNHDTATAWFDRHIEVAAPDLVRMSIDESAARRRIGRAALQLLATSGHRAVLEAAANEYGETVTAAIAALLDEPAKVTIPALPQWLSPAGLPPLVLCDSHDVLPESAVTIFCTLLAISGPGHDHPAIAEVAALATWQSRADFAWGLFTTWQLAAAPSKDRWVLHALALLGSDETVRKLGDLIVSGSGNSGTARGLNLLEVLTAMPTPAATKELDRIIYQAASRTIQLRARECRRGRPRA